MHGFGVIDGASDAIEKSTFTRAFFGKAEAGAIAAEAGVLIDKIGGGEAEERGDGADILVGEDDFAWPAAAIGAALALVVDGRGLGCGESRHGARPHWWLLGA